MKLPRKALTFLTTIFFTVGWGCSLANAEQVIVQKNDTLWEIARGHDITVDHLMKINHLTSTIIQPGQALITSTDDKKTEEKVDNTKKEDSEKKLDTVNELVEKRVEAIKDNTSEEKEKKEVSRSEESGSKKADKIIRYSYNYLGSKYQYGGITPKGFDCSGFVKYVFSNNDIQLSRTSREQYNDGKHIKKKDLIPGDLVFFSTRGLYIGHVGIYVGGNNFIHASSSSSNGGVRIDSLGSGYFSKRYYGACRVINN